jgi:hypothetical protein
MKIFKVLAVSALLLSGTVAMAQAPQGGGQGGQRQMMSSSARAKQTVETLTTTLGLSAEQKSKISDISMKYAAKDSLSMVAMRAQGENMDREAFMAERTKTREAQTAEIKAVLSDAQKSKYDEYLATARQGFGGGAPRN